MYFTLTVISPLGSTHIVEVATTATGFAALSAEVGIAVMTVMT